jgi:hypothetical protein
MSLKNKLPITRSRRVFFLFFAPPSLHFDRIRAIPESPGAVLHRRRLTRIDTCAGNLGQGEARWEPGPVSSLIFVSRRSPGIGSRSCYRRPAWKAPSLSEVLATIPDPRDPLPAIFNLFVVATFAGMRSLEAVAQLAGDHGTPLAHRLGFGVEPCAIQNETKNRQERAHYYTSTMSLRDILRRWHGT